MTPGAESAASDAELLQQLRALPLHVRNPDHHPPPPGVPARRAAVYRELVLNGLVGLLGNNFPVTRETLGAARWQALIADFLRDHQCATPLFPAVAEEFLRYLGDARGTIQTDPPFLLELAHYEWVETALAIDPYQTPADVASVGDLLLEAPVVSPVAVALAYAWPVHRIGPGFVSDRAPATPTCLLVLRNRAGDVSFNEINPPLCRLMQGLSEHPERSGQAHLAALAAELGVDPQRMQQPGLEMLGQLRDKGVIIGTRPCR
ncbi:MAG: DUF2063 domain-containing protein [Gammaproteobacteria bacterium]